jgi:hypothetical protein
VKKSFNIQELLHHKSKRHGTKPMHPSLSKAFQRHQEHNLKHPGLVDEISHLIWSLNSHFGFTAFPMAISHGKEQPLATK